MPTRSPIPTRSGTVLATIALAAVLLLSAVAPSSADLQSRIATGRGAVAALRSAIAADAARIATTARGLRAAQAHLTSLQARASASEAALQDTRRRLLTARNHLVDLENRLHVASAALSANLVAQYENPRPDLVTVVMDARGFAALLEELSFMKRIGDADGAIVRSTRTARAAVVREASRLAVLETRDRTLAVETLDARNQAASWAAALYTRESTELRGRNATAANLETARARLHTLEVEAAAQAAAAARAARAAAAARAAQPVVAQAADAGGGGAAGIATDAGGMVQPPPGAPAAVARVIAAANAIATLPYIYGGGHASFQADGYDCSGSVSYALAAAGLVSSPLDSTGFESWGLPGPGRWITVYANAGHAWMEVAGWRFDTVAQATTSTRWSQGGGEFAGFVARHPPGL